VSDVTQLKSPKKHIPIIDVRTRTACEEVIAFCAKKNVQYEMIFCESSQTPCLKRRSSGRCCLTMADNFVGYNIKGTKYWYWKGKDFWSGI
jgi:hypothetical protein